MMDQLDKLDYAFLGFCVAGFLLCVIAMYRESRSAPPMVRPEAVPRRTVGSLRPAHPLGDRCIVKRRDRTRCA